VASVLWLLPTLGTLAGLLLMLYGIYLLYLGLIPVMSTPKERAAGYAATIIAVTLLAGLLMGMMGAAARPVITGASIPDTTRLAP
jgi:hypothetical protein